MIKFYKCTAEQYTQLSKNADYFYYLTDTNKFYLGENELTNPDVSHFLTEVVAKDNSIIISNNNQVGVKISAKTGNNLSLQTGSGEEGLYVNVPIGTDYTVTITESAGSGSDPYSKRYNVVQTATGLNANIDIPKDMVVSSGSVVDITYNNGRLYDGVTDVTSKIVGTGTATEANAGKYIKLVIANATADTIYIAAKDLVDIYTAQPNATQVQLAIDSNNVISATIVAGSIDTTELKDGAVTTDKLGSKAVTGAKLADEVTASLGKADTAVQSIAQGANNGEIKYTVDGTNYTAVKVKGLGSAAYTNSDAYATAAQGALADSAVQSVTTGTSNGTIKVDGSPVSVYGLNSAAYTASTDYATAAQGSKADTAVQAIAEGSSNGQIKYTVDGTNYTGVSVHGLDTAAYAKTTDFDAAGSASNVQTTLIGTASDAASANTIYGAKNYADSILEWQTISNGNG